MGKEVALRHAVRPVGRAPRARGRVGGVRGLLRLEALVVGPCGPAKLADNLAAVRAKKGSRLRARATERSRKRL